MQLYLSLNQAIYSKIIDLSLALGWPFDSKTLVTSRLSLPHC